MSESTAQGTISVACKLPMGLVLRVGDREHVLRGARQARVIGGAGITDNVPADLFEEWKRRHASTNLVKKGLVFSAGRGDRTTAQAKEMAGERSGLEPLDKDKPAPGVEQRKD